MHVLARGSGRGVAHLSISHRVEQLEACSTSSKSVKAAFHARLPKIWLFGRTATGPWCWAARATGHACRACCAACAQEALAALKAQQAQVLMIFLSHVLISIAP
eukprot:6182665-Pleurochrysis_carterae.AAC.2